MLPQKTKGREKRPLFFDKPKKKTLTERKTNENFNGAYVCGHNGCRIGRL